MPVDPEETVGGWFRPAVTGPPLAPVKKAWLLTRPGRLMIQFITKKRFKLKRKKKRCKEINLSLYGLGLQPAEAGEPLD